MKWSQITTLLRTIGNLSIREILVMMSAYNLPSLQMLGEGEGSLTSARLEVASHAGFFRGARGRATLKTSVWEARLEEDMLYFLGGGNVRFFWATRIFLSPLKLTDLSRLHVYRLI